MTRHPRRPFRAPRRSHPSFESLETRVVPSTSASLPPLAYTPAHSADAAPDPNDLVVLSPPAGGGTSSSGPTFGPSAIPQLSSLPGAKASIYLNFAGDFTASWGGFNNITTPDYDTDGDPTTFTQSELDNITKIWRYVAEDYAPFNINVTTVQPANLGHGFTQKIDIGGSGSWLGFLAGGVSYIGSFAGTVPNLSFVFPGNLGNGFPKYVGDASSHEAGHSFGLVHQSQYDASGNKIAEYYAGPGDGTAPIMGNSYYSDLSRWWLGTDSNSSTEIQDDMAVISDSINGFGYRDDSTGNTLVTAHALTITSGNASGSGIIIKTTDTNYWAFTTTTGGSLTINMNVAAGVNNLVAKLVLVDANGNVLATGDDNSTTSYSATMTTTVAAGTYYVIAESHGGYGDVGQYTLSGTITGGSTVSTPAAPTGVTATAGDGQVALAWNAASGATSYNIYRSTTPGGEGATAYKTGVTTTSYTDTGLTDGTTYYYQVTAVNAAGESGKSSEVSATPRKPVSTTIAAIDAGGGAAGSFIADADFNGGRTYSVTHSIDLSGVANPAPQQVYQSERVGTFTYTIPNLTPGTTYTVRLHFAEIYWNAAGKRYFNVSINGQTVLTNFDIYATAGAEFKAVIQQFTATADANGNLTIKLISIKDLATLSGLEVLSTASGSASSGTAHLAHDLGAVMPWLGDHTNSAGQTNRASHFASHRAGLPETQAAGQSGLFTEKLLVQWLGTHHWNAASPDWTGDLLGQWQL